MRLHVLDSTDPAAVLDVERRDRPREDAVHRLLEVGRDDRDAVALPLLPPAGGRGGRRRAGGQALRGRDRPGQPARDARPVATGSAACSRTTRTSAAATRCCPTSGSCPPACMGVAIEALLHRCQVAEQNCTSYDQGTSNSGLWLGIVMGALANAGRDKLTFIVSEPISLVRPVGRAAGRREHGQAGQGRPAGGRRADRRRRTPTATTACSPTCATPTSPTRSSTPRSTRWRRPASRC